MQLRIFKRIENLLPFNRTSLELKWQLGRRF